MRQVEHYQGSADANVGLADGSLADVPVDPVGDLIVNQ